jgi:hypothetical protein
MFAVRSALDMPCSLAYKPPGFLRYHPGIPIRFLEPAYKSRTDGPIAYRCFGTSGRTVVMSDLPDPDLDRVRQAMREHDAREEEDERERDEDEAQDQAPDEDDERNE